MKKLFFLLLFISLDGFSQSYFYSVGIGGNLFKGDLQQWNIRPSFAQLKTIRPTVNAEFGLQMNKTFDLRFRLGLGLLHADPAANPLPNLGLSVNVIDTPIFELGILTDYNFFDFLPKEQTDFNWTPYLVGGISGFYANPKATVLSTSSNPLKSIAIPYGVGIKWKLNKKIMFRFETVARKTLTDQLDLEGANSKVNFWNSDQYINTSFSIVYSIYPIICPRID